MKGFSWVSWITVSVVLGCEGGEKNVGNVASTWEDMINKEDNDRIIRRSGLLQQVETDELNILFSFSKLKR